MGGNLFKDKTQPISIDCINPTLLAYFAELAKIFPKRKEIFNLGTFSLVGSAGKKSVSGDIDIIVSDSLFQNPEDWDIAAGELQKDISLLTKRARTSTESQIFLKAMLRQISKKISESSTNICCEYSKVGTGTMFTYFPQYSDDGKLESSVQIDWMVGNKEWLKFSYYSKSYIGNVKGLHRTQLMLAMFANMGLSFSHLIGVYDTQTRKVHAEDPESAYKLLDEQYNISDISILYDFYKLLEIVNRQSDETRENILKIYFKILDQTRCHIPDSLELDWRRLKDELGLTGKFLPDDSKLKEQA